MATAAATKPQRGAFVNTPSMRFIIRFWPWIFLLGLMVFFSLTGQGFLSVRNLSSLLVNSTLVMLMAVGQTYVIITAGIDLSVGWTVGLASVFAAVNMRNFAEGGMDPALAIVLGSAIGLAITVVPGLINGLLIAKVKIPAFIATIGMFGIVRGAAFLFTDGQNVVGNIPAEVREILRAIGNGSIVYFIPDIGLTWFAQPADLTAEQLRGLQRLLPYPVVFVAFVVLIFGFVLSRTRFGRYTYAIGGNEEAARRAGINVDRHLIYIYILAAFTAGIAGVLHVFRFTAGSPNVGEPVLLDSVAAVVIGGTSLFGGEGKISGTVVGALIIATLQSGLVILGVDSLWQFIVVGAVIIIAVLVNQFQAVLQRRQSVEMHEEGE